MAHVCLVCVVCVISSTLDAYDIGVAVWGGRVIQALGERSGQALVQGTPRRLREVDHSAGGCCRLGYCKYQECEGLGCRSFLNAILGALAGLGSESFEHFSGLFHHFLDLLEPCVFAASLARNSRTR